MKDERKATGGRTKKITATAAMLLFACIGLAALPGCDLFSEPRVKSPWTGEPATEADLVREAAAQAERVKAENEADTAAERGRIEDARRGFEAAVRTLDLETQTKVVALQEAHDATVADAQAAVARLSAKLAEGTRAIEASLARARGEIEREREKREALTGALGLVLNNPATQAGAGALPGGGLLLGLGGYALAALQAAARRKAEHGAWDEATASARESAMHAALLKT